MSTMPTALISHDGVAPLGPHQTRPEIMSSDRPTEFVQTTAARPTVDDTAEIGCRACGGSFERTDPRVFGAPVVYTCPHCGESVRLWMSGGKLRSE